MRRVAALALVALALAGGAMAATESGSPIRVTLRAENHAPHPTSSPSWQWGYCVRVRSATGEAVASAIQLRFVLGGRTVRQAGWVSLNEGYDHWCASIGGEHNVLLALPRGKKLLFQAVVTADGVTVVASWPLVVARA